MNIHSTTSDLAASNLNLNKVVLERLHEPSGLSIPELVTAINEKGILTDCQTVQNAMRVRELRERVERGEAGPVKWTEFAARTFGLKSTRLKELNQIAQAKDKFHELNRLRKKAIERAKRFEAKMENNDTPTDKQLRERLKRFARKGDIAHVGELARKAEPCPPRKKLLLFVAHCPIDRVKKMLEHIELCRS